MLHTAGLNVRDIYFTLTEEGVSDSYQKAKVLRFREKSQLANETIEQFVIRLRQKAHTCEFGDAATVDDQIRDQVISKCFSQELRRKLLQKVLVLWRNLKNRPVQSMEEVVRSVVK